MASLSVNTFALDASGLSLSWDSAAASGDTFVNNGKTVFIGYNTAASSATMTFAATQAITDASLSVPDLVITVAQNKYVAVGPLPRATFNNASSKVAVTYASASSLAVVVVKW